MTDSVKLCNERHQARENKLFEELRPRITPEFIKTLSELIAWYGWSGDHTELSAFAECICMRSGIPFDPDLIEAVYFGDPKNAEA